MIRYIISCSFFILCSAVRALAGRPLPAILPSDNLEPVWGAKISLAFFPDPCSCSMSCGAVMFVFVFCGGRGLIGAMSSVFLFLFFCFDGVTGGVRRSCRAGDLCTVCHPSVAAGIAGVPLGLAGEGADRLRFGMGALGEVGESGERR